MTPQLYDFLATLSRFTKPATRGQVGCVTSREAERARTLAKRLKYARQRQRKDEKWGWQITALGSAILAGRSHDPLPAPATPQEETP